MTRARRGPRPEVDTRAAIVAAAREEFSANGFEGASVRAVARRAEVDPALVRHYFGGKEALFAASLELPFDPSSILGTVVEGGPDGIGERLVRAFCGLWDPPEHRERLVAVLRTIVAGGDVATSVPGFVAGHLVRQMAVAGGRVGPGARGGARGQPGRRDGAAALRPGARAGGVGRDRRAGRLVRPDAAAVPHHLSRPVTTAVRA